jgi:Protein of unknown function (DUF3570)
MRPRRFRLALAVLPLLGARAASAQQEQLAATLREGVYADSDHTQVYRSLAAVTAPLRRLTVSLQEEVDIVTSASADVRASPFLDALTGASVQSPSMFDRRFETTARLGFADGAGHTLGASAAYATERDYTSAGAGLQGAWDLAERNTTVLGGVSAFGNEAGSIADPRFERALLILGYSLGVAQVLSPGDVVRARYDGSYLDGYQASPYRAVRFGDWRLALRPGGIGYLFLGTIGPANGLPEKLPGTRLRHAATLEWLHALTPQVALAASYRFADDDWSVLAQTLAVELRVARDERWQLRGGYRFYDQGAADFYRARYTLPPDAYASYTADKELGEMRGHSASIDAARGLLRRRAAPGYRATIDVKLEYLYYAYANFPLLASRSSFFGELGARMEF